MWPVIETPQAAVQLVMLIACAIIGVSHILQPELWREFFADLAARGRAGMVTKVMIVELMPALLIVSLHQVWSGPAIVLTLYGWLLLAKVIMAFIVPGIAIRSMTLPERAPAAFIPAGVVLLGVSAASAAALVWT